MPCLLSIFRAADHVLDYAYVYVLCAYSGETYDLTKAKDLIKLQSNARNILVTGYVALYVPFLDGQRLFIRAGVPCTQHMGIRANAQAEGAY